MWLRAKPERASWPHIPPHNCVSCCLRTQLVCTACQHLLTATAGRAWRTEAAHRAGQEHGAGKAGWARAPSAGGSWGWRQALTMRKAGGSSAGSAKCNLVYASQKLKYDPALLKQFSFEKLCILQAVVQLWRAESLIGSGCVASAHGLGLSLVFLCAREMLCVLHNIQRKKTPNVSMVSTLCILVKFLF